MARGADITEPIPHEGLLIKNKDTIWYVVANRILREVTPSGFAANRFKAAFIHPLADLYLVGFSYGAAIVGEESALSNRTF